MYALKLVFEGAMNQLAALAPKVKAVLNDEIWAYVTSDEAKTAMANGGK